eukprot:14802125-Alexandrium_andersonii.AAC.1
MPHWDFGSVLEVCPYAVSGGACVRLFARGTPSDRCHGRHKDVSQNGTLPPEVPSALIVMSTVSAAKQHRRSNLQ